MRRLLRNTGSEPITRYLIRISVYRYPGEPERSNAHYREHPLNWDELAPTATCHGEAMNWQAKHDRDAFKEVWLLFENEHGRFPLYSGEEVWIEYAYSVGEEKWAAGSNARSACPPSTWKSKSPSPPTSILRCRAPRRP
ncbi:hypothetical protein OG455_21300 [Kitasatospora sp. NBC_01287]|uniref:hypothetical protein n=1 Tax=Kitasatospora sp. NBC_01287 TaxID=2903573 RepID=UPI002254B919|nr:hypothetical protein [Kitasatospora sp. NBC_01287]MCX4748020.1 hypothetical protein [Kitasatospora sp. NBC_01287]